MTGLHTFISVASGADLAGSHVTPWARVLLAQEVVMDLLELAEDGVRPLARALYWLLRGIYALAVEWLWAELCWTLGWLVCRLLSLGRYPQEGPFASDEAPLSRRIAVELLGLLTLVGALVASAALLQRLT